MIERYHFAGSVLDGSKIEVVLSKPVDRETYQYVKSAKAAAQLNVCYNRRHHHHQQQQQPAAALLSYFLF